MPEDADQTSAAEAKTNADEIKWEEATQRGPRGNVHSQPDADVVEQDMPPPMPG